MMTVFLSIFAISSLVSTMVILAACAASARSNDVAHEVMALNALARSAEDLNVSTSNTNEAFAQNMSLVTS